jgi:hypothetical protein
MAVWHQRMFFLLLLLSIIQAKVSQKKIVKRRSGFEPFKANQRNNISAQADTDGLELISDDGTDGLAKARKLSQNVNVQQYFSMMNSGQPIRPIRKGSRHQGDDCTLFAEFDPMYYNLLSRSADFTIKFSSNCLRNTEVGFKTNFKKSRLVNWFMHPTTIHLHLWGNSYKIEYGKPKLIDKFDIVRAFEYFEATVSHLSSDNMRINTKEKNSVYLDPQSRNTFNKFNIQKLQNVRGRVNCDLAVRRLRGWKVRMAKRDKFIKMMKSRGATDKEITKMLNNKNFSATPDHPSNMDRRLNLQSPQQAASDSKKIGKKSGAKKNKYEKKSGAKKNKGRKKRGTKKNKGKASAGKVKKVRVPKSQEQDMTPDERRIYKKNREKMLLRYKREFVRKVEIECIIV